MMNGMWMRHVMVLAALGTAAVLTMASVAHVASEPASGLSAEARPPALPAHQLRFGRSKPLVAVVAENRFTELTDYVVPYGVLRQSGAAEVIALATREGPVQLFPALRVQPQATVAQFDAAHPQGADYVIVPAVHHVEDPALIAWVKDQAAKGATIVGVCDGVWVLGHAGLLAGRQAVGHWYSFDDLQKTFPTARLMKNTRYVADRNVVTTTGVTASVPVSLAIVEAIAGKARARLLAASLGLTDWGVAHRSDDFRLTAGHMLTAAWNWLAFWRHEDVDMPIEPGVDEVALALTADAYARTYRTTVHAQAASNTPVMTRQGLALYPDKVAGRDEPGDRIAAIRADVPGVLALESALKRLQADYGAPTADFVALQIEYARVGSAAAPSALSSPPH